MTFDPEAEVSTAQIEDVADINPESTRGVSADREISYIDISSVDSSYRITDDVPRLRYGDAPSRAKRVVRKGDILVSTVRTERRSFARVPAEHDGCVASTGFAVIRARPEKIDPEFLWGVIRTEDFVSHLVARQRGSNYPAVNAKDVAEMPLRIPSAADQRRIAWVLGSIDDKIESNRRLAKTLEEIAAALFKARFVDFIDHHDLVESEIGPIPRGWRVVPVSDAVAINPRVAAIKKGSVVPHIGMSDVPTWGTRPSGGVELREYVGGARFESGDTLMARITGCIEHGKGAFADFLDGPGAGSTEFLVLRAKPPFTPEMVFLLSRTPRVREHAIANMSGSSGRQRVQTSAFDHLRIAVPQTLKPSRRRLASSTRSSNARRDYGARTTLSPPFATPSSPASSPARYGYLPPVRRRLRRDPSSVR